MVLAALLGALLLACSVDNTALNSGLCKAGAWSPLILRDQGVMHQVPEP